MATKKKSVYYYRYHSSDTGRFISKAVYDASDPNTVERKRVRRKGM